MAIVIVSVHSTVSESALAASSTSPVLTSTAGADLVTAAISAEVAPTTTLERARAAWDSGSFDVSEALYMEAISRGGLKRNELVDALVRIGASRCVIGRKKEAIESFRRAASIDPAFQLPPDAGKKIVAVVEKVRGDFASASPVALALAVPSSTRDNQAFVATAQLTGTNATLVARIRLDVRDGTGIVVFSETASLSSDVRFHVQPHTTWEGRLDASSSALDAHDNIVAEVTASLAVEKSERAAPSARNANGPTTSKKPGFWARSWPFIAGGAAALAGGIALVVMARPSDDVAITTIRVSPR